MESQSGSDALKSLLKDFEKDILRAQKEQMEEYMTGFHVKSDVPCGDRKPFVIITVPHAKCTAGIEKHSCDYYAAESARILSSKLNADEIDNIVLEGDKNRFDIDLNRVESKDTEFHFILNGLIRQNSDRNILLIDMHSGRFKENDSPFVPFHQPITLGNQIADTIATEFKSNIPEGSIDNFVVNKVMSWDVPAILIEVNEEKDVSLEQFSQLRDIIVDYMDDYCTVKKGGNK